MAAHTLKGHTLRLHGGVGIVTFIVGGAATGHRCRAVTAETCRTGIYGAWILILAILRYDTTAGRRGQDRVYAKTGDTSIFGAGIAIVAIAIRVTRRGQGAFTVLARRTVSPPRITTRSNTGPTASLALPLLTGLACRAGGCLCTAEARTSHAFTQEAFLCRRTVQTRATGVRCARHVAAAATQQEAEADVSGPEHTSRMTHPLRVAS